MTRQGIPHMASRGRRRQNREHRGRRSRLASMWTQPRLCALLPKRGCALSGAARWPGEGSGYRWLLHHIIVGPLSLWALRRVEGGGGHAHLAAAYAFP